MWQIVLAVVALSACAQTEERASRVVDTAQGPVRGYRDPEYDLFAFYGIPYATAPTGSQRFMGPLPPPIWLQTLDAVEQDIICPQAKFPLDLGLNNITFRENCLIANVFVPDTEAKNIPVVVFVHGGAFQVGSGLVLTHKSLVKSKKIISVTFNYRLGIHGFLCLGTKDVPGNAGMKDQVALLQWVKRNIAHFGGNPDDITIDGYSAGSASVDLLMISKMTKGLFNKVILESGSNIGASAVQIDPVNNAKIFAISQNFINVDDIYALEEFYKTATYEILTTGTLVERTDSTLLFSPCIERDTGAERFLDEAPINILKSGKYKKMPMLYGFANMEGIMQLHLFESWSQKMNEKFSDFLPADLQFETEKQKEAVAKKVKGFYFGDKSVKSEIVNAYIDYFSDVMFVYATLRAIKLHLESGHNEIYLYEYEYAENTSSTFEGILGATHCAQTGAVADGFNVGIMKDQINLSEDFKEVKRYMRDLWINFILTGKPVPEESALPTWPPAKSPVGPYMSLGRTMELKDMLVQERFLFWERIYAEHSRIPMPPPKPVLHGEL